MSKNQDIWIMTANGTAHLVNDKRALCPNGGFPQGNLTVAPEDSEAGGYCRICHYFFLTGSLPKTKQKLLVKLVKFELERLVLERTESFKKVFEKGFEDRDKAQTDRAVELTQWQEKLNKQSSEIQNLKDSQKDNEKLVELGKAFGVLTEAIGDSIMKSSVQAYRGYYGGRG